MDVIASLSLPLSLLHLTLDVYLRVHPLRVSILSFSLSLVCLYI